MDKKTKTNSKLDKNDWREYISSIWKFPPEHDRAHPAPFPVELPLRLIKLFSFTGDIILDPFIGSGTTALAAKMVKRHFLGYELNKNYIKLGKKRLKQYQSD